LETIALAHTLGPAVQIKIGFSIVAALFDYSLKVHELQKVQYWIKLIDKINEIMNIAIANKDLKVYFILLHI
jgi:translation initiation factor 3 subunit C